MADGHVDSTNGRVIIIGGGGHVDKIGGGSCINDAGGGVVGRHQWPH